MYSDHGTGVVHPQVKPQSAEHEEEKIFKYSEKHGKIVKRMAVVKVLAAIGLILLQSSATAMQHIFDYHAKRLEDEHGYYRYYGGDYYSFYNYFPPYDRNAFGAWMGLMSLLAAVISLSSLKKQDKNLIIAALSMNCFSLPASTCQTAFGTLSLLYQVYSAPESIIHQESTSPTYWDYDDPCAYWLQSSTSTTPQTLPSAVFFGEKFDGPCVMFQWESPFFTAWLVIEGLMLACSSVCLILALCLMIYSSIAVCAPYCCRQTKRETVLQPTIYFVHNARDSNTEGSFSDRFRVVALTSSTHHATKSDKLVADYLLGLMPAPEQAGELTPIAEP